MINFTVGKTDFVIRVFIFLVIHRIFGYMCEFMYVSVFIQENGGIKYLKVDICDSQIILESY